jgi:AraC-like DNA-binding protein
LPRTCSIASSTSSAAILRVLPLRGRSVSSPVMLGIAGLAHRARVSTGGERWVTITSMRNVFSACRTVRPGVTLVRAELDDFAFPVHSHDHVVVGLATAGEHTSRYGLRRYDVWKGDVLLVNAGEVHDGRPSGARGRGHSMLEISVGAFSELSTSAGAMPRTEFQRAVNRQPALTSALSAWLEALLADEPEREREVAAEFFGLALAGNVRDVSSSRVEDELARRAKARLLGESPQADAIGDLARDLGASRFQLIRAYKRAFGLTPEDFRRQLRIERARSLLSGRQGLAAIAASAGFADQSHMTREFRRLVGVTPGRYRRALR